MTLNQAIEKAQRVSKADGVIQHINRANATDYAEHDAYFVSDWFDSDCTVKSFYKGREQ